MVDNGAIGRAGGLRGLSEIHAYHLLPHGCRKMEAVQADLDKRNISRSESVAVGDAASDLELANQVGAFFLVGNALSEDSKIGAELEHFNNVFVVDGKMGLGFAEVVDFLIS